MNPRTPRKMNWSKRKPCLALRSPTPFMAPSRYLLLVRCSQGDSICNLFATGPGFRLAMPALLAYHRASYPRAQGPGWDEHMGAQRATKSEQVCLNRRARTASGPEARDEP